ncbi:MAG: alpha/beta fold hydrolase [Methylophilaceae bacterium]
MNKLTLLLLPGMDGTGLLFRPFIEALGEEFDIKVVTYPTSEPVGYKELELIALQYIPSDSPYIIIGESFSGPIAISIAARNPPNLKGLILCGGFARNPVPAFTKLSALIPFLPISFVPISLLAPFILGKFYTKQLKLSLALTLRRVKPEVIRARLNAVLTVDVISKLASIKVAFLYLRATKDNLVQASASKLISQYSPNLKVTEIEAPHLLLQVAPEKAAQIVKDFIRSLNNDFI